MAVRYRTPFGLHSGSVLDRLPKATGRFSDRVASQPALGIQRRWIRHACAQICKNIGSIGYLDIIYIREVVAERPHSRVIDTICRSFQALDARPIYLHSVYRALTRYTLAIHCSMPMLGRGRRVRTTSEFGFAGHHSRSLAAISSLHDRLGQPLSQIMAVKSLTAPTRTL
jgi:hypothetical protein